ncbi:membrane protein [Sphingobacterium mizutaii NBRC 14946 = DSM 11724]|uniref:YhhN-like protein n=2 Tax=Sphingobacterium mizutaii TaxID=1010 RepID=A0AAJ5C132_9SPHI|nr:lysoplasmalogenase [Sphingobacterium mizutaii]GEM68108.1 membrane protein [Sphingobacterium mizutaii NBRC 14946 = DSM 11724]SDL27745.1 Uncharacterized membrane protein YhhN [Sphingobacterium mizutaii]SNV53626.1 YhhN-like protein [Sphingobacterium mizutaii]
MKQYKLHIAFLFLALLHLYAVYANLPNLRFFSKPLICISLIFILYKETGLKKNIEKLVAVGLFFGCLGDIFLMLNENMFVAGLASFLIGHILYVIAFSKQTSAKALSKHKSYILIAGILASFSYYLYSILKPSLGPLKIPVILYIIVIAAMAFFAYTRRYQTNTLSFIICLIGALLFIFSDSILALNKFVAYLANSGLYIMSSYILAQYFITLGIILDKKTRP